MSLNPFGQAHRTIKSHHKVGGLPEKMNLKVVEPLNTLFKDEVRLVGRPPPGCGYFGRHPFPGRSRHSMSGRYLTRKSEDLQSADKIFISALRSTFV